MAANGREVVVLGAGYAGLRCAMRLAWRDPQARITVVDARDSLCERVRLHQTAAGQNVPRRALAAMCRDAGIAFLRARAQRIDAAARVVHTDAGELRYDRLVIALGSRTDLTTPGAAEHCDRVGDEAGALALAQRIADLPDGAELLVVGGGLTGIETASELAQAWPRLRVGLVTRGRLAEGLLGARGLAHVRRTFERLGVHVREHFDVRTVERGRLCGDAGTLPFHLCVWTPGFVAPALARDSGLAVDAAGRMLVDATLRSNEHSEIYGVGDAAITAAALAPLLMSCRVALPMAALAADNLARDAEGVSASLRPFVMRDVLRCISLGRDDAIVQLHRGDGSLRTRAFGGRVGAWLKEKICRFTVWAIEHEAKKASRARRVQPALAAAAVAR